jgi:hypothetical protein
MKKYASGQPMVFQDKKIEEGVNRDYAAALAIVFQKWFW